MKNILLASSVLTVTALATAWADQAVVITQQPDRLRVSLGGELFTEYIFRGLPRPILYPVIGPHGIGMTRNFPMRDDVPGEAHDHPHHRSLWFAHRPINGVDFWSEFPRAGKTLHEKLLCVQSGRQGVIETVNRWMDPDGREAFSDTRRIVFQADADAARMIDYEVTIRADRGDVTFGDSKEGTMAIRTHPNLRLANDAKRGVTTANGQAINSEGVRGPDVWGKRARWIDYWGEIDGHTVGIAIFDHPANPRHPTHWMARGYGYIGANPFGLNAFEGKPLGTGDMTIKAGQKTTFRYRFVFHKGDFQQGRVADRYAAYANPGLPSPAGRKGIRGERTSQAKPGAEK